MFSIRYRPRGLPGHMVLRQWLMQRVPSVRVNAIARILECLEIFHRHVLLRWFHKTAVFRGLEENVNVPSVGGVERHAELRRSGLAEVVRKNQRMFVDKSAPENSSLHDAERNFNELEIRDLVD